MIKQIIRLASPGVFLPYFRVEESVKDKVLVRPTHLSICAADQRYFRGDRPEKVLAKKLPMALIHEAVGEVLCSGHSDFSVGDKVVMVPFEHPSGIAWANYLEHSRFRSSNQDGFTQETLVLSAGQLVKIQREQYSDLFALCELMSVCCQAARRFADSVQHPEGMLGVWGDGSMAYVMALTLKQLFPENPILVAGKHDSKLLYFSFADELMNITLPDAKLRVSHAFECVGGSGSQSAIDDIISRIKPGGVIGLLGVSEVPPSVNTRMVLEKGLKLMGSSRSEYEDFVLATSFIHQEPVAERLRLIVSRVCEVNDSTSLEDAFWTDTQSRFKTLIKWMV